MRALVMMAIAAAAFIGWRAADRRSVAPTPSAVSSEPGHTVTIARGADGHFRVDGDIAGAGLSFVVDTGASGIAIGRADARRAGIMLTDADFSGTARTASGTIRVARRTLPRVGIGGLTLREVDAYVMDVEQAAPLLGQSALARLGSVSIRGNEMMLAPG